MGKKVDKYLDIYVRIQMECSTYLHKIRLWKKLQLYLPTLKRNIFLSSNNLSYVKSIGETGMKIETYFLQKSKMYVERPNQAKESDGRTVWKFSNFTANQILRNIDFTKNKFTEIFF